MIDSEISKLDSHGEDTCTEILDVVFKEYEDTPIEHILKVFVDIVEKNYHSFQGFLIFRLSFDDGQRTEAGHKCCSQGFPGTSLLLGPMCETMSPLLPPSRNSVTVYHP